MPLLETPGRRARTCINPIENALLFESLFLDGFMNLVENQLSVKRKIFQLK